MAAIFSRLLGMSMTAGYLVLAVILVRLLLKRAPRRMICAFWGLVALRLTLPFSVESAFSVLPGTPATGFASGLATLTQGVPAAGNVLPHAPDGIEAQAGSAIGLSGAAEPVLPRIWKHAVDLIVNPTQAVLEAAAVLWLIGLAILLTYALVSYLALRRQVATAIQQNHRIYRCDAIDTPFILGLFKPRIYLPSTLGDQCLEHVVAHETEHIRRRDHWIKPLGFLLLAVHWFNPLVWLAYVLLCRDIELACDEQVLGRIGIGQKKAYAMSLLTCSIRRGRIAMCPVAFGEIGVRQRVKSVLNYRRPAFWLTLAAIVICLAVAIGFLTDPMGKKPVAVDERLDKAVSAAILDYNNRKFAPGVISGEGHRILLVTEGSGQTGAPAGLNTRIVYALCGYAAYTFPDGNPVMASGSFLIPTVMTFTVDANGSYSLTDYQEARDGAELGPSIRRMFPKSIQKAVLNPSEADRKELMRQMDAYAAVYLQQVGRPDTADPTMAGNPNGSKIITLASVLSPTVAKDLLKQYQAYPDFLDSQSMTGAWETDEKDGRFIYEVLWESSGNQSGKLTFRKSVWDSGKVVSNIEYLIEGEQYQLVKSPIAKPPEFSQAEIEQAKSVVKAYYAAHAARDRNALLKTLSGRYQNVKDFFGSGPADVVELLDIRYNPDPGDPARSLANGASQPEWRSDPADIMVLRVDLKITEPAVKGATHASWIQKNWIFWLLRDGPGSDWRISNMGY